MKNDIEKGKHYLCNEHSICLLHRGGQISSECLAGYWCKSGSSNNLVNRTMEFQNCSANQDCSGLCPKGSYCPQGVDIPLPCPEHTYRDTEGAETPDQCSPCPAGFYCPSGKHLHVILDEEKYPLKICFSNYWFIVLMSDVAFDVLIMIMNCKYLMLHLMFWL